MSAAQARLAELMAHAVAVSLRHVEAGGLPFVGLLVAEDGWVSEPGVNLVRETGDPTGHAEIVALRQATQTLGERGLNGATLLATGEPCALCYRAAATHGIGAVHFAVGSDTAAAWGFDYRAGYHADHTAQLLLAKSARQLLVDRALEPFSRYRELHRSDVTTHS